MLERAAGGLFALGYCVSWEAIVPTALRMGPYRFYFYSHDCGELRHMHVDRENKSAKFWLDPDVSLSYNQGYPRKELRDIERIARENVEVLRNEWDAFCGGARIS